MISKMNPKRIFVTVGTTNFPELIDTITSEECIYTLLELGYTFVQLQTGKGFSDVKLDPRLTLPINVERINNSHQITIDNKLTLIYNDYFVNFDKQITESDLVISHAGAGTCLEVLKKHKPLIVVINEGLMNNHQIELAEELQEKGYLYHSTCKSLNDILRNDFSKLTEYPKPDKSIFPIYLDKSLGFT